jgi:hypothetical protein
MKQTFFKRGWLVVAAALTMVFTSCNKEDDIVIDNTLQGNQTIHLSVSAGISDNTTTRSIVDTSTGKRVLKFTMGDKIYVRAEISGSPSKIVAGYLDVENVPADGATSASFTGDLTVYETSDKQNFTESTYNFSDSNNPLAECSSINGTLVHKDAGDAIVIDNYKQISYSDITMAATVNELMTTSLALYGNYDQKTKTFSFSTTQEESVLPIFNCTFSGLEAGATYAVFPMSGKDANNLVTPNSIGNVTADKDGTVNFAYCFSTNSKEIYIAVCLHNLNSPYDCKQVDLGSKTFASKVYNVKRTANSNAKSSSTQSFPTITGASFSAMNGENEYVIDGNGGTIEAAIGGTANGMAIVFQNYTSATVTLNYDLEATYDNAFLNFEEKDKDVNVILNGSSSLSSTASSKCIYSNGNLYFSGNGTLTTHATTMYSCALEAPNYPSGKDSGNQYEFNELDPLDISSLLAAPGCVVKRKLKRASVNDYKWNYTVSQPLFVKHSNGTTEYITSDYTAQNGDLLSGTMIEPCKISIADKATVTLAGVSINAGETWKNDAYKYAGITCLGNATLVLADGTENVVTALGSSYPGIHAAYKVGKSTYTLTITGNGKLIASALSVGYGAGIGGADGKDFGNISIEGGDISATGYGRGAGIGAAGGSVICGTIIITEGIKKVTANKNCYSPHCIGLGDGGICQAVLIDGVDASSRDWDGTGMEHLVLERSNSAKNGNSIYYKTWTLTRKQ